MVDREDIIKQGIQTIGDLMSQASQSTAPYREPVDMPYAEVEDEENLVDPNYSESFDKFVEKMIWKERVYVDDPSEVPEGFEAQEGPRGGTYYETEGTSEGQSRLGSHEYDEEESETDDTDSDLTPEEAFNEFFTGDFEEDIERVENLWDEEGGKKAWEYFKEEHRLEKSIETDGADVFSFEFAERDFAPVFEVYETDGDGVEVNHYEGDDWVYRSSVAEEGVEEAEQEVARRFEDEMWTDAPKVYHGTSKESAEKIMEEGLQTRNETRGMANRHMGSAAFTTLQKGLAKKHYATGDDEGVVLEIDMEQMKEDGYTPPIDMEPDAQRVSAYEEVCRQVRGVTHAESPEFIGSDSVVAFRKKIPPEYIEIDWRSDEDNKSMVKDEKTVFDYVGFDELERLNEEGRSSIERLVDRFSKNWSKELSKNRIPHGWDSVKGSVLNGSKNDESKNDTAEKIADDVADAVLKEWVPHEGPGCIKGRVYIDSREEAPEGKEVHFGPQDGLYYITDTGTDDNAEETDSEDNISSDFENFQSELRSMSDYFDIESHHDDKTLVDFDISDEYDVNSRFIVEGDRVVDGAVRLGDVPDDLPQSPEWEYEVALDESDYEEMFNKVISQESNGKITADFSDFTYSSYHLRVEEEVDYQTALNVVKVAKGLVDAMERDDAGDMAMEILEGDGWDSVKDDVLDDTAEKIADDILKEWVPYEGPRGGEGWQNTETGEVRYGDKPGERDGDNEIEGYEDEVGIPKTNPERDIENFRQDQQGLEKIDETIGNAGMGFTRQRNLDDVNVFDEDVYWTGMWGELYDVDDFSPEDVEKFYKEHREILDSNSAIHIGGYRFEEGHPKEGNIALDLSVGISDGDVAENIGKELNQESVANLKSSEFIDTEGDGDSPLETPEEALEYKENQIPEETLRKLYKIRETNKDKKMIYYISDDGDKYNPSGIVHGSRYGLDVQPGDEDGVLIINGKEYRRMKQ